MELDPHEQRDVGRKARAAVLRALEALGGEGTRRDVIARAIQEGSFSERERSAPAPANTQERHESYVHYRLSWALANLKREGIISNPRWSVWRLKDKATEDLTPRLAEPVSAGRLAELRAMPSHQYLRTPEWRRTRAAALVLASHRCALDRNHTDRLAVHHNTYERVGAELASDLVVLCHACHGASSPAHEVPPGPARDHSHSLIDVRGAMPPRRVAWR